MEKQEVQSYAVAGRLLMAHLLGQRIEPITISDDGLPVQLVQIKSFQDADWNLDPHSDLDVLNNKKSLMYQIALFCGEKLALAGIDCWLNTDIDLIEEFKNSRNYEELRLIDECIKYCTWKGEKDFSGGELYNYFSHFFQSKIKGKRRKNILDDLAEHINKKYVSEINSTIIKMIVSSRISYAEFEANCLLMYPSWQECFDSVE